MNIRNASQTAGSPEMIDMHDEKQQKQRSQQSHAPAVPGTPFVSIMHCIRNVSLLPVLKNKYKTLDNVNEETYEQADFHYANHDGCSHEMSRLIEHFSAIVGPDAGV